MQTLYTVKMGVNSVGTVGDVKFYGDDDLEYTFATYYDSKDVLLAEFNKWVDNLRHAGVNVPMGTVIYIVELREI
jgi:hypothetical protein